MNIEKYNILDTEIMNRLERGDITNEQANEVLDLVFEKYIVDDAYDSCDNDLYYEASKNTMYVNNKKDKPTGKDINKSDKNNNVKPNEKPIKRMAIAKAVNAYAQRIPKEILFLWKSRKREFIGSDKYKKMKTELKLSFKNFKSLKKELNREEKIIMQNHIIDIDNLYAPLYNKLKQNARRWDGLTDAEFREIIDESISKTNRYISMGVYRYNPPPF